MNFSNNLIGMWKKTNMTVRQERLKGHRCGNVTMLCYSNIM